MKKIISIVLTVFVFISCLMSLSVSAEDLTYNFAFKRSNGTSDFAITLSDGVSAAHFDDFGFPAINVSGLKVGSTLTFVSNSEIESGIYSITLYARAYEGRAKTDVSINDNSILTGLDTSATAGGATGSHLAFPLGEFTQSNDGTFKLEFTVTNTGSLYIDDVVLTKVGNADPYVVEAEMATGASIRLNYETGLRFYANVDHERVATLIEEGYTVEMGTLIAPADSVTAEKELNFDNFTAGSTCIDVKYAAKDELGNFIYFGNDGTIVGSIVNIKDANITKDFVARAYVKVTDSENTKTVINYAEYADGNIANNTRSLQDVATSLKADESATALYSKYQNMVDAWAQGVGFAS